ncbi:unnamed protein product [Rotaria socialis]|uniref:HAT C-terminal dimerisation domain-containing protein n=1 Tax=Rotaria socialis TaxID=392032 RepID=A0A820FT41_9BILA|nr:unnamed protein product [Rotaria socialis]
MTDEWMIQPKVKNAKLKYSDVWNVFGVPVKKDNSGVFCVIDGYASCFNCNSTYIKKKDTGTIPLRNHPCFKNYIMEQEQQESLILKTQASSTTQILPQTAASGINPLTSYGLVIKSIRLTLHEKLRTKESIVQWLCRSMRPFSIVNDIGLRNIVQQAISLGAKYGNIDVNSMLPHRSIITEHMKIMADSHPMHKYTEPDKRAENIIVAMNKALSPFDLNLSNTNIMCDRGTCTTATTSSITTCNDILHSSDDDSCDEADDDYVPSFKIKSKRKTKSHNSRVKRTNSSFSMIDHVKLDASEIPIEAREYLVKLKEVKHIIKYVKKAGLNDEIKSMASISLKQSSSVRWLSLMNSLQSLHRAYKATRKVLQKHDRHVYINPNDLKWLIRLLLPFQVITEKVQAGNKPSLHYVLLSTFMLRRILSSTEELQQFDAEINGKEKSDINIGFDEQQSDEDSELNIETEPLGISFFRERLSVLLESMFDLDIRHYAAVLLHPKYSKMMHCSKNEIEQTYKWIRDELKKINIDDTATNAIDLNLSSKKAKKSSLFEIYSNSSTTNSPGRSVIDIEDDDNDQYSNNDTTLHDELNHYLFLVKKTEDEPESKNEDPQLWWKTYNKDLRKLSILTRRIFSIPATSASVERQFSSAGLIFNDRRTRLSGENLENIILVRSIEIQELNDIGALN